MIPWMINQPGTVKSGKHAQVDAMEATNTMLRPELELQPAREAIIQRDLKDHSRSWFRTFKQDSPMRLRKHEIPSADHSQRSLGTRPFKKSQQEPLHRPTALRVLVLCIMSISRPLPDLYQNATKYVSRIPVGNAPLKLFHRILRPSMAKFMTRCTRLFYLRCTHHLYS